MSNIYELEEVLELSESEQKGFSINDDSTADWALRKIAEERAELERLKSIAEGQIEEINQKIGYLEKATERRTNFLKGCLGDGSGREILSVRRDGYEIDERERDLISEIKLSLCMFGIV